MSKNHALFDTSPTDAHETKKKKSTRARNGRGPSDSDQPFQIEPRVYKAQSRAILPIGKIDDTYRCIDDRCAAFCHDILLEDRGEWLLQCCFCTCTQWLPAIPGHIKPCEEQFVLRDGRFAGLTLDEVAALPRGLDYIAWAAKEHKREAVKAACKTWLDQRNTPV